MWLGANRAMALEDRRRTQARCVAVLCAAALILLSACPGIAWAGGRHHSAQGSNASPWKVGRGASRPVASATPVLGAATDSEAPGRWLAASFAALSVLFATLGGAFAGPAIASDKRLVGEIPASGLIFKDTINVEEFDDPKVSGVNLYISDFSRAVTDRLAKGDFFSDPGAAGLTCVKTGPVKVSPSLTSDKKGEDVINEARALLFKTLKVKRIYDADAKNIIYVVFTERVDTNDDKNKSRFKSQICAVHVDGVQGS